MNIFQPDIKSPEEIDNHCLQDDSRKRQTDCYTDKDSYRGRNNVDFSDFSVVVTENLRQGNRFRIFLQHNLREQVDNDDEDNKGKIFHQRHHTSH